MNTLSFRLSFSRSMRALLSVIICNYALVFCSPESTDQANTSKWADPVVKGEYVKRHRQSSYTLENASPSMKAAVQAVFTSLCTPEQSLAEQIFSDDEHRKMLWVHLPEADTPGGSNNPDAYLEVVRSLGAVVEPRLRALFSAECASVTKLSMRRSAEAYGPFTLHYPGDIELKHSSGEVVRIDLIRTVAEINGRFKVAQIGPD